MGCHGSFGIDEAMVVRAWARDRKRSSLHFVDADSRAEYDLTDSKAGSKVFRCFFSYVVSAPSTELASDTVTTHEEKRVYPQSKLK
jgi:hypothetical protein